MSEFLLGCSCTHIMLNNILSTTNKFFIALEKICIKVELTIVQWTIKVSYLNPWSRKVWIGSNFALG